MKSPCCNVESDVWYDQTEYGKIITDDNGEILMFIGKGIDGFQAELSCSKCSKVTKAIVDDNRVILT